MKYLRKFESNVLYQDILDLGWEFVFNSFKDLTPIKARQETVDLLNDYVDGKSQFISGSKKMNFSISPSGTEVISLFRVKSGREYFIGCQEYSDDWFSVGLNIYDPNQISDFEKHFKCDTIHGVMQVLNNYIPLK